MEKTQTQRGFNIITFKDRYGIDCSLQESSLATEACIWLGCNDANPRFLVPNKGWKSVKMPNEYVADTRMHLTRDMVKELIPYLQAFVVNGLLEDGKEFTNKISIGKKLSIEKLSDTLQKQNIQLTGRYKVSESYLVFEIIGGEQ
jgi:hypothetical protein